MPVVANVPDQIEAVLIRHPQVADQYVWACLRQAPRPLRNAGGRGDNGAGLFQHHNQDPPCVGFVVHDEHAQAVETDQRATGG